MLGRAVEVCSRWVVAWVVLAGSAGAARASWALREAARAGDVGRVGEALAAGDDPSGAPGEPTPLMEAAMGGHTRVMDVLARAGAELERRDQNGDRAIHWAIAHRSEPAVRWLIARHADLAARGHGGRTPLLAAVAASSLPIVERLLAAGASARDRDATGWGAAYMATIWSSTEVLAAVLAHGADPNDSDGNGESALMAAALRDNPRAIELLAARGADLAHADRAWLAAARQKARGAMAALLEYAPSTPEALILAALAGDDAAVTRLTARGVPLEAVANGMTALGAAAQGGHDVLVGRLLALGARREPESGASPLIIAGSHAVAQRLLAGPPLTRTTLDQGLFVATVHADVARVRLLLAHGARPTVRDAEGRTALGALDAALAAHYNAGRTPIEALDAAIAAHAARIDSARGFRGIPGWVFDARKERARLEGARAELVRLLGGAR